MVYSTGHKYIFQYQDIDPCLSVLWIQAEQSGFHAGRGTPDQLSTLSRILGGALEFAQLVYMWTGEGIPGMSHQDYSQGRTSTCWREYIKQWSKQRLTKGLLSVCESLQPENQVKYELRLIAKSEGPRKLSDSFKIFSLLKKIPNWYFFLSPLVITRLSS